MPLKRSLGGIVSATVSTSAGQTTIYGLVPIGSTATAYKNGSPVGAATVVGETASYTFGSALAASDTVYFVWTVAGHTPTYTVKAQTLGSLLLSGTSAVAGAAFSAAFYGQTAGSTVTVTSSDGTSLTVASNVVSGTFASPGSPTLTLTETLPGATNTPKTSTATITVAAAAGTLAALTLSPPSATVGTAYSGTISGKTAGSTVTLSGAGAAGLTVSGSTVSGTPTAAGPVNLIETLAGATGSPRTTSSALTVAAAASSGNTTVNGVSLSSILATAGSQFTATISGTPTGATITATSSDGQYFAVSGTTVKGTFALSGSPTLTLSVTPSGGSATTYPFTMNVASPNYPINTPIIFDGDSISDPGYGTFGYAERTMAKTGNIRYLCDPQGNFSSAGGRVTDALNNYGTFQPLLAAGNARSPAGGVLVVELGGNADPLVSTITSGLGKIFDTAIAAGWRVICMVMWTSNGQYFNPYILGRTDITVVRGDLIIDDHSNTAPTGKLSDGTHPNDLGADVLSTAFANILNNWSAAPTTDVYTNDVTSLVPDFSGTGTLNNYASSAGGTISGTGAAGWNCYHYQGNGNVAFNVVQDGGYPALEVVITPNATSPVVDTWFIQPVTQPSSNADDQMDMWFEYKVVSGTPSSNFVCNFQGGASYVGGGDRTPDVLLNTYLPHRTWVRGANGTKSLQLYGGAAAAGGAVTIRLRRPRVVKRSVPNYAPRLGSEGGARPNINGTAKVGTALTLNNGTTARWWGLPMASTIAYQWYQGVANDGTPTGSGTPIAGATSATYTPVSSDVNQTLYCVLAITNATGTTYYPTQPTTAVSA